MNDYSLYISDEDPDAEPLRFHIPKQYERHYLGAKRMGDGLRALHGELGINTLARLDATINDLGTNEVNDASKPTEGNARAALVFLHRMASSHPYGTWTVYG